jgi:NitT/TauT family transport system substrate-binding protein
LSNIVITADPLHNSIFSFAERADALGYLGRNGYDLSEIFFNFDVNSIVEEST